MSLNLRKSLVYMRSIHLKRSLQLKMAIKSHQFGNKRKLSLKMVKMDPSQTLRNEDHQQEPLPVRRSYRSKQQPQRFHYYDKGKQATSSQ